MLDIFPRGGINWRVEISFFPGAGCKIVRILLWKYCLVRHISMLYQGWESRGEDCGLYNGLFGGTESKMKRVVLGLFVAG